MNAYIVYIFCPVWIKFSKGDFHKNLLGMLSFMQKNVTESVPALPTRIARFWVKLSARHLRIIPFSIYWRRDNRYSEGFAFLVGKNKIMVTHVPCNCVIFWKLEALIKSVYCVTQYSICSPMNTFQMSCHPYMTFPDSSSAPAFGGCCTI